MAPEKICEETNQTKPKCSVQWWKAIKKKKKSGGPKPAKV